MKRKAFWIALAAAVLFCYEAAAQNNLEQVVQQMAEDGASEGQIEDWLQQMAGGAFPAGGVFSADKGLQAGLDINSATAAQLEGCGLFTPFQTASLLEYRSEYGAILSAAELALVDGFSAEKVASLLPFIVIGSEAVQTRKLQHEFRSRYKYKSDTEGFAQYNRLIVQDASKELCLLAESDAGERLFIDHLSASLKVEKGRWQALAGDYLAGFGQGLAVWKGFSFTGLGAPSSLMRRSKGISCNHSADENDFFRGAACSFRGSSSTLTLFASANGVDANVGEKGYTSIVTTGYHRTETEKAKKDAMREYVAGADFVHTGENFLWGATAVAYSYDKPNARKVQDYNQYQLYDGWHANLALNGMLSLGHLRLFSELAADSGFAPAALAGAVFSPSYGFEAALQFRYYDKKYIATHAGSYSTTSSVVNQQGAVLSLLWRPGKILQASSLTSFVRYPWERYRVSGPSADFKQKTRAEWKWESVSASVQHNFNFSTADHLHKHDLKISGKWQTRQFALALRSDAVVLARPGAEREKGFAAAADASYKGSRKRFSISAGATLYNAQSYASRAYVYENDLPGSFSSHYFYGKGAAYRLMVQCKPLSWISISSKVSKAEEWEARLQADLLF